MSLVVSFPKNLKRSRSKRGLSQQALAVAAGLSTSYISMLERGQRSPPLETIEKLGAALDVPPIALLKAA